MSQTSPDIEAKHCHHLSSSSRNCDLTFAMSRIAHRTLVQESYTIEQHPGCASS